MGREVRMVPPNWKHPIGDRGYLQPMHDENFEEALAEWKNGQAAWEAGTHEDFAEYGEDTSWEDWAGEEPEPEYYRPWKAEEATWYQLWETVSEGTPVTPPFATKEELADYLVNVGEDFGRRQTWPREAADNMMREEWAPSFIARDGVIMEPKDPAFFSGMKK